MVTIQRSFLAVTSPATMVNDHWPVVILSAGNITVLVSHNICFGHFIPMNHGVNKRGPPIVSPNSSSLLGLHQVCLLFYKKYFIKHFCSDQIIAKNNAFQIKTIFLFSTYCWSVLIMLFCVSWCAFHSYAIMKLWIVSYLQMCIASYLISHQIRWHNRRIHGDGQCHIQMFSGHTLFLKVGIG